MAKHYGPPKITTEQTATWRRVLRGDGMYLPGNSEVIDGSQSRDPLNTGDIYVLRAGLLMGKVTATGLWAPSILGVTTVAHTGNTATSMTVSAATATEIVRRIGSSGTFKLTGPPSSAGTVATETITFSAVNTTTGVITITATSTDFIAGSFIQPTDGPETIRAIIGDGMGIRVTDEDQTDVDPEFIHTDGGDALLIGGVLESSNIVNWPSDTSLRAWIVSSLNTYGHFVFDHSL